MGVALAQSEPILIVGDDGSLTLTLEPFLTAKGYRILSAEDAAQACQMAWEHSPPVVILDSSNEEIDAALVCRKLKTGAAPPRVMLIGSAAYAHQLESKLSPSRQPDVVVGAGQTAEVIASHLESIIPSTSHHVQLALPPTGSSFAEVLVALWKANATGVLKLKAQEIATTVYFLNGEPVFAEHGARGDTLGRVLLRLGIITEVHLSRAMKKMAKDKGQARLGEVLIELKFLTANDVFTALQAQVRDKVLACFQWPTVEYTFEQGSAFVENTTIFNCKVAPLILEGVRFYYDPGRLGQLLEPNFGAHAKLTEDIDTLGQRYKLSGREIKFLSAFKGDQPLGKLRQQSSLDRVVTDQILATMLLTHSMELLTQATKPTAEKEKRRRPLTRDNSTFIDDQEREAILTEYLRVKGRADHVVLRVAEDATEELIESAFLQNAKKFSPEHTKELPTDLARKATEIYSRMRAARDGLKAKLSQGSPPRPRKRRAVSSEKQPDERRAKLDAEAAYHRGQRYLSQNAPGGALAEFKTAVTLRPGAVEYRMALSYTEFLNTKNTEEREKLKGRAAELAKQALAQDPKTPRAHTILGQFARMDGNNGLAERMFKRALEVNPRDHDAQRELRLVRRRESKKDKPKGRKLFGLK